MLSLTYWESNGNSILCHKYNSILLTRLYRCALDYIFVSFHAQPLFEQIEHLLP